MGRGKTRKDKDGKDETYCDRGTYLVGLSIGDMGAILNGANRTGANLSGADFTDAEITQSDSQEAWAWSDESPTGLPGSMMRKIVFCIFDVSKHERWNHPEVCTAP